MEIYNFRYWFIVFNDNSNPYKPFSFAVGFNQWYKIAQLFNNFSDPALI